MLYDFAFESGFHSKDDVLEIYSLMFGNCKIILKIIKRSPCSAILRHCIDKFLQVFDAHCI